jgi:hypothetical protein
MRVGSNLFVPVWRWFIGGGFKILYNDLQKGRYLQANQLYFITTVLHQRKPLFYDFFCAKIVDYEMKALHDEGILGSLVWVICLPRPLVIRS